MRRVFADTGYWVALLNPKDELHQKARDLSQQMDSLYIFTSEMVLAEVLNDFSKRGQFFRQAAIELIENLYNHPNVTVIQQSSSQFQQGLLLYKTRLDKETIQSLKKRGLIQQVRNNQESYWSLEPVIKEYVKNSYRSDSNRHRN